MLVFFCPLTLFESFAQVPIRSVEYAHAGLFSGLKLTDSAGKIIPGADFKVAGREKEETR